MGNCPDRIKSLRFVNDNLSSAGVCQSAAGLEEYQERLKCNNLASSTRIVSAIFPEIAKAIEDVRERLIPDFTIDAYVQNSAEFQAYCFPGSGKSISIALTSGLIQLNSMDELRFVIGHELGHHLLGHHAYPNPEDASNQVEKLNILALNRAAEISADRVGFVAATNKGSAYKAVLKLATGLPDKFVRFDLSAYLDQARELNRVGGAEYGLLSTHPTCTTRMRALLWFDMSESYYRWQDKKTRAPLTSLTLDNRVAKDLAAVGGFRLAEINKDEADSAMFWGVLSLFVSDGCLSKDEQILMNQSFGESAANDAFKFLRENGPDGVMTKFKNALRSVRLMDEETKEALYQDLERFAKLAGGETHVREQVLQITLNSISLHREINLR